MSREVEAAVDRVDALVYGMQFKVRVCREWLRAGYDPPVELIEELIDKGGELQSALERCKVNGLPSATEQHAAKRVTGV